MFQLKDQGYPNGSNHAREVSRSKPIKILGMRPMTRQKEAIEEFRNLGWAVKRGDGDTLCIFELGDRDVSVIPKLRNLTEEQVLRTHPSISTREFSDACTKISKRKTSHEPLAVDNFKNDTFYSNNFSASEIEMIAKNVICWARQQNLKALFDEHCRLPTDSRGAMPLRHLAALALAGDVAKLKFYQSNFEAGGRLGFVPYITKDYIDRAVALAEEYAAKS